MISGVANLYLVLIGVRASPKSPFPHNLHSSFPLSLLPRHSRATSIPHPRAPSYPVIPAQPPSLIPALPLTPSFPPSLHSSSTLSLFPRHSRSPLPRHPRSPSSLVIPALPYLVIHALPLPSSFPLSLTSSFPRKRESTPVYAPPIFATPTRRISALYSWTSSMIKSSGLSELKSSVRQANFQQ